MTLPFAPSRVRALLFLALPATLVPPAHAAIEPLDVPPAWSHATDGPIHASPGQADNTIYIGGDDRHLRALDARSGAPVWTCALSAPVRCQPRVDGDAVLVVSGNTLSAVARSDGRILWTFTPNDDRGAAPADRWDYHTSSAICVAGTVYYGGGNGRLFAIDRPTGAAKFTFATDELAAIRTTPAVAGGAVFFGDWNGVIYAVDAASGQLRWKLPTLNGPKPYPQFGGAVSAMVVHDGRLYFGLRNPEVLCLDAQTGARLWTFTAENGTWVPGTPTLEDGTVYIVGSDDHRVHALDAASGTERWFCDVGQNMFSAPLLVGRHIIVGDSNCYSDDAGTGRLHVIDRASGRIERTIRVGGNIGASSPLLVGDLVVFGSEDGRVLAYRLGDLLPSGKAPTVDSP